MEDTVTVEVTEDTDTEDTVTEDTDMVEVMEDTAMATVDTVTATADMDTGNNTGHQPCKWKSFVRFHFHFGGKKSR